MLENLRTCGLGLVLEKRLGMDCDHQYNGDFRIWHSACIYTISHIYINIHLCVCWIWKIYVWYCCLFIQVVSKCNLPSVLWFPSLMTRDPVPLISLDLDTRMFSLLTSQTNWTSSQNGGRGTSVKIVLQTTTCWRFQSLVARHFLRKLFPRFWQPWIHNSLTTSGWSIHRVLDDLWTFKFIYTNKYLVLKCCASIWDEETIILNPLSLHVVISFFMLLWLTYIFVCTKLYIISSFKIMMTLNIWSGSMF